MTEAQEADWTIEARRRIEAGERVLVVARDLGVDDRRLRYTLNLNGARDKKHARVRASRQREREERVGVKPKAPGRRSVVLVNDERMAARAYADPAPARPLTLPKISLPAIDEPVLIRFVPKITVRSEPEGVERIRQIHRRMIRMGKIAAPDLVSAFNA